MNDLCKNVEHSLRMMVFSTPTLSGMCSRCPRNAHGLCFIVDPILFAVRSRSMESSTCTLTPAEIRIYARVLWNGWAFCRSSDGWQLIKWIYAIQPRSWASRNQKTLAYQSRVDEDVPACAVVVDEEEVAKVGTARLELKP